MNQLHSYQIWTPFLTDHISSTIRDFELLVCGDLTVNIVSNISKIRQNQGWEYTRNCISNVNGFEGNVYIGRIISYLLKSKDRIHIFFGPFGSKKLILLVWLCSILNIKFYIVSEPYNDQEIGYFDSENKLTSTVKKIVRPLLYKLYVYPLRNKVRGIFCISELAKIQFKSLGVSGSKLYSFGYFIDVQDEELRQEENCSKSILNMVFVGALVQRKNLQPVIDAVQCVNSIDTRFRLDIYGAGDIGAFRDVSGNVRYYGKIPFGSAPSYIANYDVLVLPSLHDGWGVVINEALSVGTPVICSSKVGAKILVERFECGIIAEGNTKEVFQDIFVSLLKDAKLLKKLRNRCSFAAYKTTSQFGASILFKVISDLACNPDVIENDWNNS